MVPEIDVPAINVAALLREHGHYPKKSLGQNFLNQPGILKNIIIQSEISKNDVVLEVGAGIGCLTRYLAESASKVVAVELDKDLIPILSKVLFAYHNVQIVQGDILKFKLQELMPSEEYLVVANIPYLITSALIRHLLESSNKPRHMVLTVQREVAERICAAEGRLSILALSVQVYGKPRAVLKIPASAFYPSPKVDSTSLRIDLYPEPLIPLNYLNTFFTLVRAGFGQKRKMLKNSLANGLNMRVDDIANLLRSAGIDDTRRAETLTLDEWRVLVELYLDRY